MADVNDGGPAFPLTRESSLAKNYEGMSLRDWFAGQALAGMLAAGPGTVASWQAFADSAYHGADAMLKARKE